METPTNVMMKENLPPPAVKWRRTQAQPRQPLQQDSNGSSSSYNHQNGKSESKYLKHQGSSFQQNRYNQNRQSNSSGYQQGTDTQSFFNNNSNSNNMKGSYRQPNQRNDRINNRHHYSYEQHQYQQPNQQSQCQHHQPSQKQPYKGALHSYSIIVSQSDTDICEKTANTALRIQQSMAVDATLQDQLDEVYRRNDTWLNEQQRSQMQFYESLRQRQVEFWLQSRTEQERQQYYYRTGVKAT